MPHSAASVPTRLAVGNDVVDLGDRRCAGKVEDARFLRRIFTPMEQDAILAADDPERALWLRWAAKEAAFKVVSKQLGGPPPFRHASFEVELAGPDAGRVRHQGSGLPFRLLQGGELLHVVALANGVQGWPREGELPGLFTGLARVAGPGPAEAELPWDALLADRFSDRERPAVHSMASARVRLEARARLAVALAVEEARLEIVAEGGLTGRTPPVALLDGAPAPADVSLSHHGLWVAWALLVWERPAL